MTTQLKTAQDLTDLRTRLGLSREDLAAKLGVTPSAVGKWERGVTFPSGRRLKVLYDLDEVHAKNMADDQPQAPQPEPELTLHEYMDRKQPTDEIGWRYWPDATHCRSRAQQRLESIDVEAVGRKQRVVDLCTPFHLDGMDVVLTSRLYHLGLTLPRTLRSFMASYPPPQGSIYPGSDDGKGWVDVKIPEGNAWLAHALRAIGLYATRGSVPTDLLVAADRIERGDLCDETPKVTPVDVVDDERAVGWMWQASPNPQEVTIDWQALVSTHQGVRGVSLRHLVELGLYGKYQDAAQALERDARNFTHAVKLSSRTGERGPLSEDFILTNLRAVQRFCSSARTEMGARILDVILDHHDELQAMLAGDEQAKARHEQAKNQAPPSADPLDALASMIEQMRSQRDAIEAQAKRQQQLEEKTEQVVQLARRLETTPLAGERSAYQVAEEAGVKSNTGRPHSSAVVALIAELGLHKEGLAWQVPCEISGKIADTWRVNSAGAAKLKYTLAQLAKQGVVLEDGRTRFTVQGSTRQYTVYR
jgi:transcriptional regulator with XRE-family HTH domain